MITVGTIAAATAIVAAPFTIGRHSIRLAVGEKATQDVFAPRPITYLSQVRTEKARTAAAAAVPEVYDAPDSAIGRRQTQRLQATLAFITSVRADNLAAIPQKQADLAALRYVTLTETVARLILYFDDSQWAAVQSEAQIVLEQIMRAPVRPDQVPEIQMAVPGRISSELSKTQAQVVSVLVAGLISPNSFYNEAATLAARQAARQRVEPIYRQIDSGQLILRRDQTVTEDDLEALQALGLLQTGASWQTTAAAALFILLIGAPVILYTHRFHPELGTAPRQVLLIGLLSLVFLLAAKLMAGSPAFVPFLFPAAALAMLLTVIGGAGLALIFSAALAAAAGHMGGNWLELTLYLAIGAATAALTLSRTERINQFFRAGLAAGAAHAGVILAFHINDTLFDPLNLAQLLGAGIANGVIISAPLTLAGFFLLGGLFGITTSMHLLELARPDHPLLQLLLRQAPGTYQHSLQVANLAEQAAESIGANALLVRVGALYHDIGKIIHPENYVENQLNGLNIHENLDPQTSAGIILAHVNEGLKLARRYRLPACVRAFIPEHHGTLKTMYQYKRAMQLANDSADVKESAFTYPGPRPQSRETALLMLADGCEAKSRSDHPQTEDDLIRIVKSVIDDRVAQGQLDDSGLTLRDLQLIRASFVNTLKGAFHPRLRYPEEKSDGSKLPQAGEP